MRNAILLCLFASTGCGGSSPTSVLNAPKSPFAGHYYGTWSENFVDIGPVELGVADDGKWACSRSDGLGFNGIVRDDGTLTVWSYGYFKGQRHSVWGDGQMERSGGLVVGLRFRGDRPDAVLRVR